MALTLQGIRDFVRDHLDLEPVDLPDRVLDQFVREGSKRVERAESRWPFYEASWTLELRPGDRGPYAVSSLGENVRSLAALEGDRGQLQWVGYDEYVSLNPRSREGVGRPWAWAEWADELWFHPTPDEAYEIHARGYRKPADWVSNGSGATPDMPEDLHNFIQVWTLSKAYIQQEDPELGAYYERQALSELEVFSRRMTETGGYRPMVLNGRPSRVAWPRRLAFPFEV